MTDQTDAEPVAYALYRRDNGDFHSVETHLDARSQRIFKAVPLYAHPESSEAADELEAMRIERDNWRMSAEEAERAEKRWKDRAVEAERERDRLDEAFDRDLPWRYDEVEAQRNQLAAVVEKVRLYCENQGDKFRHHAGRILDMLTAPADALREVKAAAWDEGHDAGWKDRHQDALAGWMPSDPYESEAVNPYRKEQS